MLAKIRVFVRKTPRRHVAGSERDHPSSNKSAFFAASASLASNFGQNAEGGSRPHRCCGSLALSRRHERHDLLRSRIILLSFVDLGPLVDLVREVGGPITHPSHDCPQRLEKIVRQWELFVRVHVLTLDERRG